MSLYAISDLHLSLARDKPMEVFGSNWKEHHQKIRANWLAKVRREDTVIIAGDISWAMDLAEARTDLDFVNQLPGRKVLIRGNHDYWWDSLKKLRDAYPELVFIQNDFTSYGPYAICGTRGWLCPNEDSFDLQDEKIYRRELIRLENSLRLGKRAGYKRFICALHYPPFNAKKERSGFMELIDAYRAEIVIYGHIHGEKGFAAGVYQRTENPKYLLTSCDYLSFDPKLIIDGAI